ncbi:MULTISPECIES: hypothetical protein [Methylosinus]|uniref:hypothetical protein n=1 Tax=Methylosinus TaxID=425 RepID=UPI0001D2F1B9|nr:MULTISPECIES: hypothetical protein [Methylosinus]
MAGRGESADISSGPAPLQLRRLRAIPAEKIFLLHEGVDLPSLIRFLVIVAVLAGLAYAAMLAIVATVTPQPREMTQTINPQRLNK